MCALPYYMCTSSSKQHSVLIPPTSNAVSLESLRKFEGGVLGAGSAQRRCFARNVPSSHAPIMLRMAPVQGLGSVRVHGKAFHGVNPRRGLVGGPARAPKLRQPVGSLPHHCRHCMPRFSLPSLEHLARERQGGVITSPHRPPCNRSRSGVFPGTAVAR